MMALIAPNTTEHAAHPAASRFFSAVSFIQAFILDGLPSMSTKFPSMFGSGWSALADVYQCLAEASPVIRARVANTNDAHFIFIPCLDW
jgi:hypothetical protein